MDDLDHRDARGDGARTLRSRGRHVVANEGGGADLRFDRRHERSGTGRGLHKRRHEREHDLEHADGHARARGDEDRADTRTEGWQAPNALRCSAGRRPAQN